MGKGNRFAQQALSLAAAATLLPGMPAVAGAAKKAQALQCFNKTGGKLRLHLEEAPRDKVPSTVACVTEVYGLGSRDPEFLDFATEASRRGFPVDSAVPRYRNMQLSGSAGYSGSGGLVTTAPTSCADPSELTGNRDADAYIEQQCVSRKMHEAALRTMQATKTTDCVALVEAENNRRAQYNNQILKGRGLRGLFNTAAAGAGIAGVATKNKTLTYAGFGTLAANLVLNPPKELLPNVTIEQCVLTNGLFRKINNH
jgi:hypothetical protein